MTRSPVLARPACAVDLATGVVTLHGDLDHRVRPHLAACLAALTVARPRQWVIDLRAVTFCDVAALRLLLSLQDEARRRGSGLVVVLTSPLLRRALSVGGLDAPVVEAAAEPPAAGRGGRATEPLLTGGAR
ncbi:STAS domain-containing protein [Geodermatophilus nigrescens]